MFLVEHTRLASKVARCLSGNMTSVGGSVCNRLYSVRVEDPGSKPPPEPPVDAPKPVLPVRYEDVSRAYYRIRSGIHRTPCKRSKFLSELTVSIFH